MLGHGEQTLNQGWWWRLLLRSVVAGAVGGIAAGWLLFFVFGFIGLADARIGERMSNGWEAALDLGVRRGLIIGLGMAVGLALFAIVWAALTKRLDPRRGRPWLSGIAAAIVVVGSSPSVEGEFRNWDEIGIVTVLFMGVLAAVTVWLAVPWVMRPLGEP